MLGVPFQSVKDGIFVEIDCLGRRKRESPHAAAGVAGRLFLPRLKMTLTRRASEGKRFTARRRE